MAFLLWLEGNANYKPNPITGNSLHIVSCNAGAWSFRKKDIPLYTNSYFYKWKDVWWFFHKKNMLPYHNKGWYEHSTKIIEVITMFDNIYYEYKYKKENETINKF